MLNLKQILATTLGIVLLSGCGDPLPAFPTQTWEDIRVDIETRPPRVERGMNEFLIIATRGPRAPASKLIVSLRVNDEGPWVQAIQDGHLGAYRRAMPVSDPTTDVLYVHIEHDNRVGILRFPISEQRVPAQ